MLFRCLNNFLDIAIILAKRVFGVTRMLIARLNRKQKVRSFRNQMKCDFCRVRMRENNDADYVCKYSFKGAMEHL